MTSHSSFESRARRLANKVPRDELLQHAQLLQRQELPAARVFWRALVIFDEDRSLMASMAATDYLGDAVYSLRPRRLPSDPVGVEQ